MRLESVVFDDGSPVDEQEARALAIHEAVGNRLTEHLDEQWTNIKRAGAVGAVVALLGVGLLAADSPGLGAGLVVLGLAIAGGGVAYSRQQEPNVTVRSVEKGYWTGYMIPDRNGTVVFDATDTIDRRQFTLELLEDPEQAAAIRDDLASISDFPVVLERDENVEASFIDSLSDIDSAIDDAATHEIAAPVIEGDDPAMESLSRLVPKATAEPVDAGGISVSMDEAHEQVDAFGEFEEMADEDHGESVLLNVSEQSRELANELSGLQETAIGLLNDHIGTVGDSFGLISYHFYCPDCIGDDVESRLEVRGSEGQWYCETCRSNFEPGEGVPRHRIRDDIVLEMTEQLWIEKDDQRREIYESIEDQKADLEEREFEQRREEIRTAEERIKDVRARIRDLQTEAKAKEGIVDRIGELMVEYERLNERKKEQFRDNVAEAFEEIDEQTEEVLEETRGIVQDRIDEAEKEAKEKAETMREEERQFQRELIAYQEQRADERAEFEQDRADERAEFEQEQAAHRAKVKDERDAKRAQISDERQAKRDKGVMQTIKATSEHKPDRRGR
jgi:hypothetical protein